MQGWFSVSRSINVAYHSNKLKDENHTVLLTEAKKGIWQNSASIYDKTLNIVGIVGMYLSIKKVIYDTPKDNIKLKAKTKNFSSKIRSKTRMLPSPLLIKMVSEVLEQFGKKKK